ESRIQIYRGDVIQISGKGATKTFTVRKMSSGVGVERIFPLASPNLVEVKILKRGKVRRAKLYYLRELVGKRAKIKEKKYVKKD
ncbi:MAG TPA: 50S ribosomal protein L19, partial [Saprospirales bacterium]|nr:50S ribosomal protein L19 [Saprospirales bacterium]